MAATRGTLGSLDLPPMGVGATTPTAPDEAAREGLPKLAPLSEAPDGRSPTSPEEGNAVSRLGPPPRDPALDLDGVTRPLS